MNIIVFGARGDVGSSVVMEAIARGHDVTAVVRNPAQVSDLPAQASVRIGDVLNTERVETLMKGHDLAVSALRPPDGQEEALVALTRSILDAATRTKARVIIVGGAASLRMPDDGIHTVLTAPGFLPEQVVPIARASFAQYELCQAETEADWTYLSPPGILLPGERTGIYRRGTNDLLVDGNGESRISIEDFAVALVDEAERPNHRQERFTVAA